MKIKRVEGPLGLKVKEATAKSLEDLLKTVPKEYQKIHRKQVEGKTELGNRWDISIITTDALDSDLEVVNPKGCYTHLYERDPVVRLDHGPDIIGRCLWIKPDADRRGLLAKTSYDQPEYDFVWKAIQAGHYRAKSIGFIPLKIREFTKAELQERPDWKAADCYYEKWAIVEYSAVGIPANLEASALVVAKHKKPKLNPSDLLKALKLDPKEIARRILG